MTMRRLFDILIAAVGIAVLGFACWPISASALDGTAPVEVANGDVTLACPVVGAHASNTSGSHALMGTGGAITCTNDIPADLQWSANNRLGVTVLTTVSAYAVVKDLSISYYGEQVGEASVGEDAAAVGCWWGEATDGTDPAVELGNIRYDGLVKCAKVTGTTWSANDRLKIGATGELTPAADDEVAVGVAASAQLSTDTEGKVVWGYGRTPPDVLTALPVKHIAIIGVSAPVNINSDSFGQIGPSVDFNQNFTAGLRSTQWFAGNIVSGITCRCDTAPATGKTVDFELCRNNEDCGVTTATDLISTCSQITDSSSLECTDSGFATTATVDSDDLFIKQTRNASSSWCQYPTCRFAYTQAEY